MTRLAYRLTPTLLLCALTALPCFGQTEDATISGRITDSSGAVVAGVSVQLQSAERGTLTQTTTNDVGIYVFPAVRPGVYHVTVHKQGFQQVDVVGLTANVQAHIEQNFSLQVGAVSESVTVGADIAKINTESAAVSTVVDSQFVDNMPLNGRSFQSLIELTPGVVLDASFSGPGTLSVNGQRTDANYFTVDGVRANVSGIGISGNLPGLTVGGGTNGLVSVDAMQEFRVQTSTYAPEFGRTPGAQISIVTKGGTNQWHGTVFDSLRNDIFDARNWFDNPPLPKPPTRQNNFGGTFSGPLWKNRTFFFFSYEGLRTRLPQTESGLFFFDAAAKAAIANSPTAGIWKAVVAATPTGTGDLLDPTCDNVTNGCLRELSAAFSNPSNFDAYSLRLDHRLTSKISLFARYDHTPSNSTSYGYSAGLSAEANLDTATFGLTATLSPTLLNDFRGNWSRQTGGSANFMQNRYGAVSPPLPAVIPPGINTGSFTVFYAPTFDIGEGPRWGQSQIQTLRQLNFVDTLSKTVGSHQLKFGVDYRRLRPTQLSLSELDILAFGWDSVLNGQTDFLINHTADTFTGHINNLSLFGQDTWQVSPRLTLTYGLRWEINTPPVSDTPGKPLYPVEGIFNSAPLALGTPGGTLWNTQLDAFAPRFGAAFQLTPGTVLRGGFGLFYDLGYGWGGSGLVGRTFPSLRSGSWFGIPLDFSYQDPDTNLHPYQPLPFTTEIGPEATGVQAIDPKLRLPFTYQWNVAVERGLGTRQSITATYVGASGRRLLYNARLILPDTYASAQLNGGISHYNSLQLQFIRRMSHGLQALVSYTYSRSSDMNSGGRDLYDSFASISAVKLPPLTPSDYDIHRRFSAAISYEIPKLEWGGKVGEEITKGWSLDGLYRYQVGAPIDVTISEVDPILGTFDVRPTRVPGEPVWIPDATQPAGKALNPAAFTLQANGLSDNALRNSIRSPYGISQLDLALRRRFNLTERVKLDIRAEFFNLFNHPIFGGTSAPSTFWGNCDSNTPDSCTFPDPGFGLVLPGQTRNNATSPSQIADGQQGQDSLYAVGGPRSAQFTLRLTF